MSSSLPPPPVLVALLAAGRAGAGLTVVVDAVGARCEAASPLEDTQAPRLSSSAAVADAAKGIVSRIRQWA
jgi:hypothetical protein